MTYATRKESAVQQTSCGSLLKCFHNKGRLADGREMRQGMLMAGLRRHANTTQWLERLPATQHVTGITTEINWMTGLHLRPTGPAGKCGQQR